MPFIMEVAEVNGRCLAMIDVLIVFKVLIILLFLFAGASFKILCSKPRTQVVSRPIYRLSFYYCRATT
jgi:hypothetical protein